jgi:tetratricopeptide (TPR) repeat protein
MGAIIYQHIPATQPVLELTQAPGGQLIQKATSVGFAKETGAAGAGRLSEAKDYFGAGERAFAETRYRDAAHSYRKSIDVLPTMAGYLNLGIALSFSSEPSPAEQVLHDGIQMARKNQERGFESAFFRAFGTLFANQGRLEKALTFHEGALGIARQNCDPLGQATALDSIGWVLYEQRNLPEALEAFEGARRVFRESRIRLGQAMTLNAIGMVYADQGRLEEALKAYQGALQIARQTGDLFSQAASLNNIGLLRSTQGRFSDALIAYTAALEIYRGLGHLLEQADSLSNIAILSAKQRKTREPLELMRTARSIYVQIGAGTKRLRAVEETIGLADAKPGAIGKQ